MYCNRWLIYYVWIKKKPKTLRNYLIIIYHKKKNYLLHLYWLVNFWLLEIKNHYLHYNKLYLILIFNNYYNFSWLLYYVVYTKQNKIKLIHYCKCNKGIMTDFVSSSSMGKRIIFSLMSVNFHD